jgi:2-dehydro-3-deoxyglucarate aldolase
MIEHAGALPHLDTILETPGIDAALIGPYDLSASMGMAGQLDHPEVRAAQQTIVDACRRHGVPAGIHVVAVDGGQLRERLDQGYRFIACGIDTQFLMHGCRMMLAGNILRGEGR